MNWPRCTGADQAGPKALTGRIVIVAVAAIAATVVVGG